MEPSSDDPYRGGEFVEAPSKTPPEEFAPRQRAEVPSIRKGSGTELTDEQHAASRGVSPRSDARLSSPSRYPKKTEEYVAYLVAGFFFLMLALFVRSFFY